MKILGVHGIGQYRGGDPAAARAGLTAAWRRALSAAESLPWEASDIDVDVAYYSHLLRPPGRQSDDALDPDAEELLAEFLAEWMPALEGAQGRLTAPLRRAVALFAEHHRLPESAVRWFVETCFREVARFLRSEGDFTPKTAVIDEVAAAMDGADIVIAHSLGSVVAYETLWRRGIEVPLLVTLGSPLAMPSVVFPRLTPAPVDGMGAKPPGVGRWVNLADHGDLVAIPAGGVSRRFTGVHTDRHDSIATFDFHTVANYLRCTALGEALRDWKADG